MSFPRGLSAMLIVIVQVMSMHAGAMVQITKNGPTSAEILARVAQTYSSCRSYSDEGTVAQEFTDPKGKVEKTDVEDRFTTAFVRSGQFKFDFRHDGPNASKQSVIWIEKDGPRNWQDLDRKVMRPESLDFALGQYAGITMGASQEIPQLLFAPTMKKLPNRVAPFSQLKDLKRLDDVKIDGLDCFRVEGLMQAINMQTRDPFPTKFTYEVEKSTFLIRRFHLEMNFEIGRSLTTITYKPRIDNPLDERALSFDPAKDAVAKPK